LVSDRVAQQRAIRESALAHSMAMHPAGKGVPQDNLQRLLDDALGLVDEPVPAFEEAVFELAYELADTLISKQADYGPRAINDAPGGATNGVLVRAHDKLARLANLTSGQPNHEAIRDSWLDLAGYAFIGLLLAEGSWPK
jgi:hypothetical protein